MKLTKAARSKTGLSPRAVRKPRRLSRRLRSAFDIAMESM
jgi:hypothetical protein